MQLRHIIQREAAPRSRQDASTTPTENRQRLRSQWRPVAPTNLRCHTASARVLSADACGIDRSAYGTRVSTASGAGLLQADKPSIPLLLSRIGVSTTYRAPWTRVWFRCPHTPAAVLEGHRWHAVLLSRRPRCDLHRDLIPCDTITLRRQATRQMLDAGPRQPIARPPVFDGEACLCGSHGCHLGVTACALRFPTERPAMSDADTAAVRMLDVVVRQGIRAKHERWYEDKVITVRVIHETRTLSRSHPREAITRARTEERPHGTSIRQQPVRA